MANGLEVDASGLRVAAGSSELAATELNGTWPGGPSSSNPSGTGVAAVNAALAAVQGRQSARMTGQAGDLAVSGARYDAMDSDGGDAISTTVTV
ncbi:hypothetical protein [Mycolicibacterium sp. HK-90]|uniref:hypothetical protein n=1 Tax=Mycolicibacterium sp. HK-90 TaxID=3056937 RepID=UPI002659E4EC|nr:hypothetical protein [Mycolicibacterium sp. HK-90]WKG05765.1 hypothetical protein QU592_12075 [Mycolicibacterium sp. HK-90]